ncbi:MAG: MBL fold metallo-hydrolase [Thermodesulfobacteriota bacterium]
MKVRILGCGTSTGVPVIGCRCDICRSPDPRNKRTRSSILINTKGKNILIDTSTDLRYQALANDIRRIDAVLFTHPHADHVHGIDELRTFNMIQGEESIPCYGNTATIERIQTIFGYIFAENHGGGWRPNLTLSIIDAPLQIGDIKITPIEIAHGNATILGFRIDNIAYLTDCSGIPEPSLVKLAGIDFLIVGALRHKPHPSHFTVQEALDAAKMIAPGRTILTHLSHGLDYVKDSASLPANVELGYDGMEVEV